MSRIEGVQCDRCEKVADVGKSYIPQGWYTVVPEQGGMATAELHFCCLGHLHAWIESQVDDLKDLVK